MTGALGRENPHVSPACSCTCLSTRTICAVVQQSPHLLLLLQRGLVPRIFEELFRRLEHSSKSVRTIVAPGSNL